ncbi:MAG: DUF418 domain-containing protein [Gammaproteobacteria bacterium]|nr:DUF418 domain-containing protein [Gammaproteobacteria bacterium]MDH5653964.1 DUF418 domain-containing protein [Gammaproteobacteria bacterium]
MQPLISNTLHQPSPDVRVVQLDVLRGAAVLGIYWVNVMYFALPYSAYVLPVLMGEATLANNLVWGFSELMVDGTMRALFSMLFGASAMLFLAESRLAGGGLEVVDRYYRRTILLIIFGLIHAWILLWPQDVLYAYGLLGLFLFPLRKLSPKALFALGFVLLILGDLGVGQSPAVSQAEVSQTMSDTGIEYITKESIADTQLGEAIENQIEEEIALYHSGYWTIFESQKKDVIRQQSSNVYDTYFFDVGGMMLIGMGLFAMGIFSGQRTADVYLPFMVVGYLIGFFMRFPEVYEAVTRGFNLVRLVGRESTFYNVGRLAMTIGHIGLICLLYETRFFARIANVLARVGRMALTNYMMQSLLSMLIFYGVGFGLYGQLERYELLYVCVGVWVFLAVFSYSWLYYFHYGPMEWVWRSMIYAKRQKFRRDKTST